MPTPACAPTSTSMHAAPRYGPARVRACARRRLAKWCRGAGARTFWAGRPVAFRCPDARTGTSARSDRRAGPRQDPSSGEQAPAKKIRGTAPTPERRHGLRSEWHRWLGLAVKEVDLASGLAGSNPEKNFSTRPGRNGIRAHRKATQAALRKAGKRTSEARAPAQCGRALSECALAGGRDFGPTESGEPGSGEPAPVKKAPQPRKAGPGSAAARTRGAPFAVHGSAGGARFGGPAVRRSVQCVAPRTPVFRPDNPGARRL